MKNENITTLPDLSMAWKKYVEFGEVNEGIINQPIIESWKRSNQASVNPLGGVCQHVLEHRELIRVKDKKNELLQTVNPLMEYYYQLVKGTGVIFVLIDEKGYILDSFGDSHIIAEAKEINFVNGASWTENQVGTNAIGTALQIKKPINVTAAEHYCQKHHNWTCSSAPILDSLGKIQGIVDISGPWSNFHRHTLGIAAAIANTIIMQSIMQKKGQELLLIDKRFSLLFNNTSDGIVEVDAKGIIKRANLVINQLFNRSGLNIVGKPFEELFGWDFPPLMTLLEANCLNYECSLPYKNEKRNYLLCGESIIDASGAVTGGLIIFKRIDECKYLVNNVKGDISRDASFHLTDIIGNSPGILEAKQIARLAAKSLCNVLLQGECGTGKELFAQALHNESPRREGPFVAVNCGAIPKDLISSELFGYEEGAFTGAKRGGQAGKFEIAAGGTLFLDEIGDMPFEQQVALLRVLQEKRITRVGGNREIPVDVRIICATNKNLFGEVLKGSFRQDLYYRLNVININIPPLRERREDIILLFTYFLRKSEMMTGLNYTIEPEVINYIQEYHWPGNVRELQNVVERLVSLSPDRKIGVKALPREIYTIKELVPADVTLPALYEGSPSDRNVRKHQIAKIEKQKIIFILDRHYGNVSRAAGELGMSRNTLYRKMREYGINN